MSQVNYPTRLGSTFFAIESTHGTTPGTTRVFPNEIPKIKTKRTQLKVTAESARAHAHQKNILGLESGEASMEFDLRVATTQLNAAATPATPSLGLVLKALLGGEASGAGSTIASAVDGDTFDVGAGHGVRFKIGTWIAVDVAGTLEAARVINVATDTLTVWPALSGTPATSAVVYNSYTYYLTSANAQSCSLQHAKAAAAATAFQWTLAGGTGNVELKAERDSILQLLVSMMFAQHTGPSAQSVVVTVGTDTMSAPIACVGATTLVQTPATTTRVHYPTEAHSWKIDGGMQIVPQTGGTVQGTTGVMRVPARPAATASFKHAADTAIKDFHDASTTLSFVAIFPVSTLLAKRYVVIDIPAGFISDEPDYTDTDGRGTVEYPVEALEDGSTTTSGLSGTDLDLALSCIRVALI